MVRVGIVGATGYGGREALRLLRFHPQAEVVAVASTSVAGRRLDEELPAFRGVYDLEFQPVDAQRLASQCDVVFLGAPGTKSMGVGKELYEAGARIIDLGPDFRLKDPEVFKTYYKNTVHTAPELLSEAVYGMPPYYRDRIRDARIVACPGCYPASALLPLRPLADLISETPVVIDAVSGISGAGRSLSESFHFPEMNENLKAYKLGVHQHTPEIEQELGGGVLVQFTPHVAPLTRGILATITVRLAERADVAERFRMYDEEPFVRVYGEGVLPEVRYVRGSSFCDIGWVTDKRTGNLLLVSAIDNLVGGTAGTGVQCMNLMCGLDETLGLNLGGMAP